MLLDRIMHQFEHIESVVFVLKYYLHFRQEFDKNYSGYLPPQAYLHTQEVLNFGIKAGEFSMNASQIEPESKVITHAINGFLLEYYPHQPKEKELEQIAESICEFIMRSLNAPRKIEKIVLS